MGSVAEAVLEFDEAVQVPWRPRLAESGRPAVALQLVPPHIRRRAHAERAARLTVPPPLPPATPEPTVPVRRVPRGSTAAGHTCVHCARADRTRPALRLTRRARRLLGVVVAAVAVLVGIWVGSVVAEADEGLVLVSESSVVVREGDTLWSIARSVGGDQDVRAVIDAIREVNDLQDATLQPGQVLRLP